MKLNFNIKWKQYQIYSFSFTLETTEGGDIFFLWGCVFLFTDDLVIWTLHRIKWKKVTMLFTVEVDL